MLSQNEPPLTLEDWAGSQHLELTLLFTDIVASTDIGVRLGDRRWIEDLFTHFSHAREIASSFDCYIVKAIGDALMMAFRVPTDAVNCALEFAANTGIDYIGIKVGINSGQVQIRENDIYGLNVNFTSRVQHVLLGEGILVSNSVKEDYEKALGSGSGVFAPPREEELKSFGKRLLYRARTPLLHKAVVAQRKARQTLLIHGKPL